MSEAKERHDTMLYKHPGPHDIHGSKFDYTIVDRNDADAFEAAIADGWCKCTDEALKLSGGKKPVEVTTVATPKKSVHARSKKKGK